jgi:plastocyanin
MKKIFYLAVLTVFILSSIIIITACGGGTTEPTPAPAPAPATGPAPTPGQAPTEVTPPPVDKEADVIIEITDGFYPKEATIPVGGRVVWYNKSDRRWWVSSPTKTPDTGVIPVTQRMGFTFNEAGEYEYYDLYHKDITGKIIVK